MNLVTGATGHIGNVLVKELVKRGEKVRVFVLPDEDLTPLGDIDVEIVKGNILDKQALVPAMKDVDYVFHLAGIISIMPGKDDVVHNVNVNGTRNMIEAAKNANVKKFIHTSSIHAFKRIPHGYVVDENTPIDPDSTIAAYDKSKAEATLLVLDETKNGFPAVVVCPTGVIGPFDYKGSELGVLIQEWMKYKVNFLIEGDYDFVDVRDVVEGMILAKEKGKFGQIYILSGQIIKVADVWRIVKELISMRSTMITIPTKLASFVAKFTQYYYQKTKSKPRFTTYSIETLHTNAVISNFKARSVLGYEPRSIRESLHDTVKWWKQEASSILKKSKK